MPCKMMGFSEHDKAEAVAYAVVEVIRIIGETHDVSGIEGITVGFDYDAALASVDRGRPGLRPLTRTTGDAILGVAMAAAVWRDAGVRTHFVFWAPLVAELLSEDEAARRRAIYLVAHECGHAIERAERDRVLPGLILQHRFATYEEGLLFQPAEAIWEEYAACRYSAAYAGAETEASYREGLRSVVRRGRAAAHDAIRSYRIQGDVDRMLVEAGTPIAEPLRLAAYLAGHIDGRGRDALKEMQEEIGMDDVAAAAKLTHLPVEI